MYTTHLLKLVGCWDIPLRNSRAHPLVVPSAWAVSRAASRRSITSALEVSKKLRLRFFCGASSAALSAAALRLGCLAAPFQTLDSSMLPASQVGFWLAFLHAANRETIDGGSLLEAYREQTTNPLESSTWKSCADKARKASAEPRTCDRKRCM